MATLIFAYLIHKYDPQQLWNAVSNVNLWIFIPISAIYFLILYFVDCGTISYALTRFGYPTTYREVMPARGVTYLIMILSYPASQAAFAYYFKRTKNIPIFEVLGIFFFVSLLDLYLVTTLGFVGSFFYNAVIKGIDIAPLVQRFAIIAYAGFVVNIIFWSLLRRAKRVPKFISWITDRDIFCVFKEAQTMDYLKIGAMRIPIHISIIFFLYMAIKTFHAEIPFVNVLGSVPIAFLVGTIPITPGGLGTTNYIIVEMLKPYISGPLISKGIVTAEGCLFALTLLWMITNYSFKAILAFAWLQKVSKNLFSAVDKKGTW